MYTKLGLDSLHEDDLRYLIVTTLSRSTGFSTSVMEHLQEDIADVNKEITISEEVKFDMVKEVVNKKNDPDHSDEWNEQEQKISTLKNEKEKKKDEQVTLNSDTSFYGPQNEFYMMKGKCYDKTVRIE